MSLSVPGERGGEPIPSNLGQIPASFWSQLADLNTHLRIMTGQVSRDLLSAVASQGGEAEVTEMSFLSQELKSIGKRETRTFTGKLTIKYEGGTQGTLGTREAQNGANNKPGDAKKGFPGRNTWYLLVEPADEGVLVGATPAVRTWGASAGWGGGSLGPV